MITGQSESKFYISVITYVPYQGFNTSIGSSFSIGTLPLSPGELEALEMIPNVNSQDLDTCVALQALNNIYLIYNNRYILLYILYIITNTYSIRPDSSIIRPKLDETF